MKILQIIACFLLMCCFTSVQAQKYSNEFLAIGVGAKAQGLGNAFVARTQDVTASYWNPAGLANIDWQNRIQVGAMHAEWFAGIGKYDYLGVAMPFSDNKRVLGLTMIRFGIDDIPNTLTLYDSDGTVNYDNIVPFSAADYAMLLTYAQGLNINKGNLTIGANLKIVHRRIGPFAQAWGFGLDAGAQYHLGKWQFGFMVRDLTNTFNAWSFSFTEEEKEVLEITNNEIPINSVELTNPSFVLGVARQFQLNTNIGLAAEVNFKLTTDGQRNTLISADPISIDPLIGLEWDYRQFVFLRMGLNNFQKDTDIALDPFWTIEPTLGIGLKIKGLQLDYAFADVGEQRNDTYSHVVSVVLSLGKKNIDNKK